MATGKTKGKEGRMRAWVTQVDRRTLGRGTPIRETTTGVGSKPGRFKKTKDPRKGVGSQRAFIPEGSEQRSEDNLVAAVRVGSSGQRWAKGYGQASVIIQAGEGDGGWKWLVRMTDSGRENLDLDEKVELLAQLTNALSKDESAIWGLTDRKAELGPY